MYAEGEEEAGGWYKLHLTAYYASTMGGNLQQSISSLMFGLR